MNLTNKTIHELPFICLPHPPLKILLDTGSSASFINYQLAEKHFTVRLSQEPLRVRTIHGTSYTEYDTLVPCDTLFHIKNLQLRFHLFNFHSQFDLLLGLDNLKILQASIDFTSNRLRTPFVDIPLNFLNLNTPESHTIDSRCAQQIQLQIQNLNSGDAIIPYTQIGPVEIPQCLTSVTNSKAYVLALNNSSDPFTFSQTLPISVEKTEPVTKPLVAPLLNLNNAPNHFDISQLRLNHMNEEEKSAIIKLVTKYSDIFHQEGMPLPFTNNVRHVIRTTDEFPVYTRNYRFPQAHLGELDRQMDELLQQGIVRDSQSPWNAPLWIVPKKLDSSGKQKFRVVVDFRKLNEKTIEDKYPLPQVSELLDKLGRCQYFSTIDLKSGFHQIEMDPDSIAKTAFSTPTRHLEWTRVPFGLKNAPSTFQRAMDNILRGIANEQCCVYLDDIIVYSTSLQEHICRLEAVFKRLRAANLKIQLDKTDFLKREVAYLGHIITPEGVKPNPDKISAILNYPVPKTTKEIKGFLGLLGYYRKFIPNFAHLTKPMTKCLKKGAKIDISNLEYQQCFETCKTLLTNDPILQYPDFSKPFRLTTDASNTALGAVLSQLTRNNDMPVAYASRTLNDSERNYSAIEKELLAIVWAVGYFRPYLYGRKFSIFTDHRPLQWLFAIKEPSSRLFSWKSKLQAYDFEITYKKGSMNVAADALSRIQLEKTDCSHLYLCDMTPTALLNTNDAGSSVVANVDSDGEGSVSDTPSNQTVHSNFLGNTVPTIPIKDQPLNSCLKQIVVKLSKYPVPNPITTTQIFDNKTRMTVIITEQNLERDIINFVKEYITPKVRYGIYFKDNIHQQFSSILATNFTHSNINMTRFTTLLTDVTRETERVNLIAKHHLGTTNHRGINETYEHLKRNFYWPNLKTSIQKYINNCETCLKCKYERTPIKPTLNITPTAARPLEILHIDKFTIQNSKFLTIIDAFSKYAQAYPLNSSTSAEIVNGLLKFFAHHGTPTTIVSDNGAEFQGSLIKDLMALHGINIHFISSQHPDSNGVVERFHSTLIEHARLLSNRDEFKDSPIRTKINYAVIAYNNSIHSVTKLTPFELLYGHIHNKPLTEIDLDQQMSNNYLEQHKQKTKALYEQMASAFIDHKNKVANAVNQHRTEIPNIPSDVFVKNTQRQNKTKAKYNKEQIKEINEQLKTALIHPRHHNTKEKIHLSNVKPPRKYFSSETEKAWDESLDKTETLAHKFGLKITRDNILTLKPGYWVDDMIVNFYMELIDERSRNNSKLPSTFCFNTFFYTKLLTDGYDGVQMFTRRSNIFEKDIIMIPIHEKDRSHWTLVIVKMKTKEIMYLDSLSSKHPRDETYLNNTISLLETVQSYLAYEYLTRHQTLLDSENWTTTQLLTTPQQINSDDCGVLVCQFAKTIALNGTLSTIDPQHTQQIRTNMCVEILKGTLL